MFQRRIYEWIHRGAVTKIAADTSLKLWAPVLEKLNAELDNLRQTYNAFDTDFIANMRKFKRLKRQLAALNAHLKECVKQHNNMLDAEVAHNVKRAKLLGDLGIANDLVILYNYAGYADMISERADKLKMPKGAIIVSIQRSISGNFQYPRAKKMLAKEWGRRMLLEDVLMAQKWGDVTSAKLAIEQRGAGAVNLCFLLANRAINQFNRSISRLPWLGRAYVAMRFPFQLAISLASIAVSLWIPLIGIALLQSCLTSSTPDEIIGQLTAIPGRLLRLQIGFLDAMGGRIARAAIAVLLLLNWSCAWVDSYCEGLLPAEFNDNHSNRILAPDAATTREVPQAVLVKRLRRSLQDLRAQSENQK